MPRGRTSRPPAASKEEPINVRRGAGRGPIIPEEDFREAIAACRQDPELDRYFRMAPKGARLFIGLGFYSTHFAEKTDKEQHQACLTEIEPSLTPNDLKYLIRFERDA